LRHFVTGCAGFIGSHLTDRLLADGHTVVGFDNLSTGRESFLDSARQLNQFELVRGDLLDSDILSRSMRGCDYVWHLAANADVRYGTAFPRKDLEQNIIATFNLLSAMRESGTRRICFASSGSVYGDAVQIPTPEDAAFPIQTSLYGASKCAAEGLIAAHCAGFGMQAFIFRFVSILGERYSHGHVIDFYKQLLVTPGKLHVLGNGRQRKSYLYVHDCIDAMLLAVARTKDSLNIFNLGSDGYCEVNDSIGWICKTLGVTPSIEYSGGDRGWIGDSPFIYLDTQRIRALGWEPRISIRQSVITTLEYLIDNPHTLGVRR
jgi:UDP-glucose 4-epimerase